MANKGILTLTILSEQVYRSVGVYILLCIYFDDAG